MEEGFLKGGYNSLEEHMQEYAEIFLTLQREKEKDLSALFVEKRECISEREGKTKIFLPAVCLRECYSLTQAEYWIMMFAFCCELENGLCIDYRNKYKENWPCLQYALHLLSSAMPVDFIDVAEICGKNSGLRDILTLCPEGEAGEYVREKRGFLQNPLYLSPAVFHFLLTGGLPWEDWYTLFAADGEGTPGEGEFLPLHEKECRKLCEYLGTEEPLRILLYGRKGSGSHTLVRRACDKLHANVLFLSIGHLFRASDSCRLYILQTLRLIVRLLNPVTAVEFEDECSDPSGVEKSECVLKQLFRELRGSHLCILARAQAHSDMVEDDVDVRISLAEELSREEARLALRLWAAPEDRRQWQEELLDNYRLNIGELKRRHRTISLRIRAEKLSPENREVWLEEMQEKQEVLRLGRLVEDRYRPEEIILPTDCQRQLETAIRLARAWRGGKGLQLLFHGNSGTGKTMAAAVIAGQLQLPLFKVDLSRVFDKYIGETEKHIDEIFRTARRNNYLLFFDEADALFAKRTAVRDSHDRYANVSAAFLLQRMEEYDGFLILATNLKDCFDDAFVRRIRFVIKFRNLDADGRERLWRKVLEGDPPAARDVDFGMLAEAAELSPARISAAAQVARLLAAADRSGTVTRSHLREALILEAGKDETAIKRF